MRIVQSLYTRSLSADVVNGYVPGGWPTWKHYWYSWVLSAWQAHLTHGAVDLVTDEHGARILADELGLPYHDVDLSLGKCEAHPDLTCYANLSVYAQQKESFLHIQPDVYLWRKLPDRVLRARVLAKCSEGPQNFRGASFHETYTRVANRLADHLPWLPRGMRENSDEILAFNTGVFGGRDVDSIRSACEKVKLFIDHKDNSIAWQELLAEDTALVRQCNLVIEHMMLCREMSSCGVGTEFLFTSPSPVTQHEEADVLGLTHVGTAAASADSGLMFRLEKQVRDSHPAAWRRIEEGFDVASFSGGDSVQTNIKQPDRGNGVAGPPLGRPYMESVHDTRLETRSAVAITSPQSQDNLASGSGRCIDVIYPYIHPKHDDESLRYSIRSVERYLGEDATIWVIGDRPEWLNTKTVRFIPQPRISKRPYRRFIDWVAKLMTAVRDDRMGDRFILMYDDIYFIEPISVHHLEAPFASDVWDAERLGGWKPRHAWRRLRKLTLEMLLETREVAYEFETHVPKVFEKKKFLELADRYDFGEAPCGIHTLYFNEYLNHDPLLTPHPSNTLRTRPNIAPGDLIRQMPGHRILNHSGDLDPHGSYSSVLSMLFPAPTAHELLKEIASVPRAQELSVRDTPRSTVNRPDMTVITPTGDRPELFRLAEKWMGRQTFTGRIQWIVADDGKEPTIPTMGQEYLRNEGTTFPQQLLTLLEHVRADKLLIWEDDDWYAPNYIETMHRWLDFAPIVGSAESRRYAPGLGKFLIRSKLSYGITAQTGMTAEAYDMFADVCRTGTMSPDKKLWERWKSEGNSYYLHPNDEPLYVGIKGMPGRQNATSALVAKSLSKGKWRDDSRGAVAKEWFGDDYCLYQELLSRTKNAIESNTDLPLLTPGSSNLKKSDLGDNRLGAVFPPKRTWALPAADKIGDYSENSVTLITPTCDRPEMFGLLEYWVSRQQFDGSIQWIVCDYGRSATQVSMNQTYIRHEPSATHTEGDLVSPLMTTVGRVRSGKVLLLHDTNYYDSHYLMHMSALLDKYPLVGEGMTRYYDLEKAMCCRSANRKFASLGQTGIRSDCLRWLAESCEIVPGNRWIDIRLWRIAAEQGHLILDGEDDTRLTMNMVGMPGRKRHDLERRREEEVFSHDPDGSILDRWAGEDAAVYRDVARRVWGQVDSKPFEKELA